MATPETITLQLKAKHFKGAEYVDICGCAISKAAKEFFKTDDVHEGVYKLTINNNQFSHKPYMDDHFDMDYAKAKELKFNSDILREIVLTPIQ